jgi:hypothetical protein
MPTIKSIAQYAAIILPRNSYFPSTDSTYVTRQTPRLRELPLNELSFPFLIIIILYALTYFSPAGMFSFFLPLVYFRCVILLGFDYLTTLSISAVIQ